MGEVVIWLFIFAVFKLWHNFLIAAIESDRDKDDWC